MVFSEYHELYLDDVIEFETKNIYSIIFDHSHYSDEETHSTAKHNILDTLEHSPHLDDEMRARLEKKLEVLKYRFALANAEYKIGDTVVINDTNSDEFNDTIVCISDIVTHPLLSTWFYVFNKTDENGIMTDEVLDVKWARSVSKLNYKPWV